MGKECSVLPENIRCEDVTDEIIASYAKKAID